MSPMVEVVKRSSRFVLCAVTIAAVGGCVRATFVPTQSVAYPSADRDCQIEVFSSALPDREYIEIGIVEAQGKAWKSGLEHIMPELKGEGCGAGGDALIIMGTNTFSEGEQGTKVQRTSATVIRWKTR
ncbi:MAG: hypothetical protein OSA81_02250 [Longimicrobiales bacterium]|nr:hypothetical protein [Longimicrobiales bacterium]